MTSTMTSSDHQLLSTPPRPPSTPNTKTTSTSANNSSNSPTMILTNLFQRATGNYPAVPSLREVLQSNEEDIEFFASLEHRSSPWAFFRREEIDLGEVLHKGQFHEVYAINGFQTPTDTNNGCPKREALVQKQPPFQYSLKTLHSQALIDPKTNQTNQRDLYKAVKEMVNDAKYLSRLQHHPNILNVHGLSRDAYGCCLRADQEYPGQSLFMITDRIHETLAQRIHQWRLMTGRHCEPNEDLIPMKANYAFQIAKALKHCHDNGILLRGLQPSRVAFVTEPNVLQLTDFGLAREFPPRQQQHHHQQRAGRNSNHKSKIVHGEEHYKLTLAGTRRYLAGEVLTTSEYTLKSDTYCWAMVYYEMLTERKPYHGLTSVEHQRYVCEGGERPDLSNMYLPDEIDDILMAAWHPVLSKRLTMDQVCDKMQAFLMNLDVHYYDQRDGDFLFDVEVTPSEDLDDISEIELDQYLIEMQQQQEDCCYETSSSTASLTSLENALAELAEEERLFMASFKSLEDSGRRTLTPSVESKPRKVISEAA